jgi:hypothetical protein
MKFINRSDEILHSVLLKCKHNISYRHLNFEDSSVRKRFVPESNYFKFNKRKINSLDLREIPWPLFRNFNLNKYDTYFGYYQSIGFLKTEINIVIEELLELFKDNLVSMYPKLHGNFAFIHIRGGDYNEARHKKELGVLSENYYLKIHDMLSSQVLQEILIFTDDADHASTFYPLVSNARILSSKATSELMTLRVMSQASMGFIANSSFSWWGGMLAMANGGKVYAPYPWFLREKANLVPVSDLYADEMELLESSYF